MAASSSGNVWGLLAAIVGVALVTAVLANPNAANTIRAIGESFGGILSSAMRAGG